jgi:hypothetical protein
MKTGVIVTPHVGEGNLLLLHSSNSAPSFTDSVETQSEITSTIVKESGDRLAEKSSTKLFLSLSYKLDGIVRVLNTIDSDCEVRSLGELLGKGGDSE